MVGRWRLRAGCVDGGRASDGVLDQVEDAVEVVGGHAGGHAAHEAVEDQAQEVREQRDGDVVADDPRSALALEEIGPAGKLPDGKPFPMVIEPWPGGRWYRDLGDNAGHLWGPVQVIKPPALARTAVSRNEQPSTR